MSDMLQRLTEIQKRLREQDPLLQRGILPDWVCVVHPSIVQHLIEALRQLPHYQPNVIDYWQLDRITGRGTYIFNSAVMKMEYMPYEEMVKRYGEELIRKNTPPQNDDESEDTTP